MVAQTTQEKKQEYDKRKEKNKDSSILHNAHELNSQYPLQIRNHLA